MTSAHFSENELEWNLKQNCIQYIKLTCFISNSNLFSREKYGYKKRTFEIILHRVLLKEQANLFF